MKKILTIIGARPQFIKAFLISRQLKKKRIREVVVHTGQHYDYNMSGVFFSQFDMPCPNYNLGISSKSSTSQVGRMLLGLEKVMIKERPDLVLVYGDTNSTLAGALAAAQMRIKLAHVEAGLRSYNKSMPEEINRIITDKVADILFCPTKTSRDNLRKEGIEKNVHLVGDVMYDSLKLFIKGYSKAPLKGNKADYILSTLHRAHNTQNLINLRRIFKALGSLGERIIMPLHPRTKKAIRKFKIKIMPNIQVINPVSYAKMLELEINSKAIITDSGGVQKEAFIIGRPCITLREETEWVETVNTGRNILVGSNTNKIKAAFNKLTKNKALRRSVNPDKFYGAGDSYKKIVSILMTFLKGKK